MFSNSLLLVMGAIWVASWLGQSVTGRVVYNAERFDHQQAAVSWWQYLGTPDFWNRTLQNWQSEFLAVGSMAVLSIYLRQRGSPESKPVGAPHTRPASRAKRASWKMIPSAVRRPEVIVLTPCRRPPL